MVFAAREKIPFGAGIYLFIYLFLGKGDHAGLGLKDESNQTTQEWVSFPNVWFRECLCIVIAAWNGSNNEWEGLVTQHIVDLQYSPYCLTYSPYTTACKHCEFPSCGHVTGVFEHILCLSVSRSAFLISCSHFLLCFDWNLGCQWSVYIKRPEALSIDAIETEMTL